MKGRLRARHRLRPSAPAWQTAAGKELARKSGRRRWAVAGQASGRSWALRYAVHSEEGLTALEPARARERQEPQTSCCEIAMVVSTTQRWAGPASRGESACPRRRRLLRPKTERPSPLAVYPSPGSENVPSVAVRSPDPPSKRSSSHRNSHVRRALNRLRDVAVATLDGLRISGPLREVEREDGSGARPSSLQLGLLGSRAWTTPKWIVERCLTADPGEALASRDQHGRGRDQPPCTKRRRPRERQITPPKSAFDWSSSSFIPPLTASLPKSESSAKTRLAKTVGRRQPRRERLTDDPHLRVLRGTVLALVAMIADAAVEARLASPVRIDEVVEGRRCRRCSCSGSAREPAEPALDVAAPRAGEPTSVALRHRRGAMTVGSAS